MEIDGTTVSRYERDRSVAPVTLETYRGMRRRFRRGQEPTAQQPSIRDLDDAWDQQA